MSSSFSVDTLAGLADKLDARVPSKVRFGWGWLGTGEGWLHIESDHFRIHGQVAGKAVKFVVPRRAVCAASIKQQRRVSLRIDRQAGSASRLTWLDTDPKAADRLFAWLPDAVTADPSIIDLWYEGQLGAYRRHAWLSYALALLLIAVFVWQALNAGSWSSIPIPKLVEQGGNLAPFTLDGEPWRLLTAALLHAGLDHLLGNLLALLIVAPYLERVLGRGGLLGLFIASAMIGSLVDLWLNFRIVCVGASGAVFALYGAVLAYALRRRGQLPMRSIYTLLISAGVYIAWQFKAGFDSAGTNNAVHVAGAISGFVLGLLIAPPLRHEWRELRQIVAGTMLLGLALGLATAALPKARETDNWKFVVLTETLDERYEAVRQDCVKSLEQANANHRSVDGSYAQACLARITELGLEVQSFRPADVDLLERQGVIAASLRSYYQTFAQTGLKSGGVAQLVEIESAQQRIASDCQSVLAQVGHLDNSQVLGNLQAHCIDRLIELERGLATLIISDPQLQTVAGQLRELLTTRRQDSEAVAAALQSGDVEAFNRAWEQVQSAAIRP
jgi:membrane associated rhomboid family serine protease